MHGARAKIILWAFMSKCHEIYIFLRKIHDIGILRNSLMPLLLKSRYDENYLCMKVMTWWERKKFFWCCSLACFRFLIMTLFNSNFMIIFWSHTNGKSWWDGNGAKDSIEYWYFQREWEMTSNVRITFDRRRTALWLICIEIENYKCVWIKSFSLLWRSSLNTVCGQLGIIWGLIEIIFKICCINLRILIKTLV